MSFGAYGPGSEGQNIFSTSVASVEPIRLSGDVSGEIDSTRVGENVITYSKLQVVEPISLIGNPTANLANAQAITLGTSLAFKDSVLNTMQPLNTGSSPTFIGLTLSGTIPSVGNVWTCTSASGAGAWKSQTNEPNYVLVSSDTTLTSDNNIVDVITEEEPVTINLPSILPYPGWSVVITDNSGNASINNITINGKFINISGKTTKIISKNNGSVTIHASKTQYLITQEFNN